MVAHDPIPRGRAVGATQNHASRSWKFRRGTGRKLDAQDEGKSERGRRALIMAPTAASARSRRRTARFVKADYQADRLLQRRWGAIARAERFDGKLVLVTNVADLSASEIVTRHKNLDIERASGVLKSDPRSPLVFHPPADRIRAHALICFLALVLYRVMRMRLKASGSSAGRRRLEISPHHKHRATIGERTTQASTKTTRSNSHSQMSLPEL